jgi:phosphate transport system protein
MIRRLDRDISGLRELLLRMGSHAEAILDKALRAAFGRDVELADEVVRDDLEIDRLDLAVDESVLRELALQSPVAVDLRQVIAIKSIATDLERVGDLARNIAGSARRLSAAAPVDLPPDLEHLGRQTQRALRRALDSFAQLEPEAAQTVLEGDDELDGLEDEIVRRAIEAIGSEPSRASQLVDVILIAENLERVGDHATNIAEDVILVAEAKNVKHAYKLGAFRE